MILVQAALIAGKPFHIELLQCVALARLASDSCATLDDLVREFGVDRQLDQFRDLQRTLDVLVIRLGSAYGAAESSAASSSQNSTGGTL